MAGTEKTEAQIMADVYKEVDRIGGEINKARDKVAMLCDGMPGTFVKAAQSALSRGIKGKLIVKVEKAQTTPLRAAGGAQ